MSALKNLDEESALDIVKALRLGGFVNINITHGKGSADTDDELIPIISNGLTEVQYQFNRISAYTKNDLLLTQSKNRLQDLDLKERAQESKNILPGSKSSLNFESTITILDLLKKNIDKLNDTILKLPKQTPTESPPIPSPAAVVKQGAPTEKIIENTTSILTPKFTIPGSAMSLPTATATLGTVAGTAALGNLIAKRESGKAGYNAYNKGTLNDKIIASDRPIDLSKMTIDEYLKRSTLPISNPNRLFAVGKYQIIPETMKEAVNNLKIDTKTTRLTPEIQEDIFNRYLISGKRKAVKNFLSGKSNDIDAAVLDLAKEFASIGVPRDVYRGKRLIVKGKSYYSGKGGNKASNSPEVIAEMLIKIREKNLNIASVDNKKAPGQHIDTTAYMQQKTAAAGSDLNKQSATRKLDANNNAKTVVVQVPTGQGGTTPVTFPNQPPKGNLVSKNRNSAEDYLSYFGAILD